MSNPEKSKKSPKSKALLFAFMFIFIAFGIAILNSDKIADYFQSSQRQAIILDEKEHVITDEKPFDKSVEQPVSTDIEAEPGPGLQQKDEVDTANIEDQSQLLADRLKAFFDHLDNQQYISEFKLTGGSQKHFNGVLRKLFANPPIVSRETDDLFTILKNMAHFYRMLGKNDIILIKNILANEEDRLESVMSDFYQWTIIGQQYKSESLDITLPLKDLYEYASFFLNTLGGQSYLFRRDAKTRMLVKYYAILLIDRANTQSLNRHGIDIRFSVDSLLKEMETAQKLLYKNEYLGELYDLQEKYQTLYGIKLRHDSLISG